MPRRITARGPLQSIRLRGKTLILAQKGDSLYPAVIPRSATGGATNYSLTCNAGSFTLTGSSATISRNRALTASAGNYTYTGSTTTIKRNRALTANSGSYTYTGQTVAISRNRALTASAGSYNYTGQQATILKSKLLNASAGSYTYTGQTVEISRNRVLAANAGSYTLTGQSVDITYTPAATGYSITALPGSYSLLGSDIQIDLPLSVVQVGDGYAYYGYHEEERKKKRGHISPVAAKAIIERSLRLISPKPVEQNPPEQTKKPKATTQKPVAADAIAAQSQAFLEAEKAFLVEQAVSQVIEMATALDAEIKAEFAAIEIANQLQTFEEEMLFMFMMACEA